MVTVGVLGLYVVSVASCFLSVFNHFRYETLKNTNYLQNEYMSHKEVDDVISRHRRDVKSNIPLPTLPENKENSLFTNLKELKEFIREEINQSIHGLLEDALETRLIQLSKEWKCNCSGSKGERGMPGPKGAKGESGLRGLRGENGKMGLGLFPPQIKSKILNIVANTSEEKVVTCTFFGNPLPDTRWVTTASNTDVKTEIDRENSLITTSLRIRNISWKDRGNVSCLASNLLGKSNESGLLTVHAPPIISLPSESVIATLGSTFNFPECKVISNPPAKITWKRGFLKFLKARTEQNNGMLRILDVQVQDEGYYECIAENYLGTTSKHIQLRARPLQFSKKPPVYIYESNSVVTLSCSAFGSLGKLFGTWSMHIGETLLNSTGSQRGTEFEVSLDVSEGGKYKCSISDNITTIESYTQVVIFKLKSSIMNSKQTQSLGRWLRSDVNGEYKLCWRRSLHDVSTSTFHNHCDNKPNTISIFKNQGGEIFGGFTDVPWKKYTSPPRYKFEGRMLTWLDAEKECQKWGGHLVTVTSQPQNDYLVGELKKRRMVSAWIGLNDLDREGIFKWSVNPDAPTVYTNWVLRGFNKQPNGGTSQSCVEVIPRNKYGYSFSGEWNDKECNHQGPSICENHQVQLGSEYGYSSQSFLFTFQPKPIKIRVYNANKAICYKQDYGPCFGENELYYRKLLGESMTTKSTPYTTRSKSSDSNTNSFEISASVGRSYKSNLLTSLAPKGNAINDIEVFYKV